MRDGIYQVVLEPEDFLEYLVIDFEHPEEASRSELELLLEDAEPEVSEERDSNYYIPVSVRAEYEFRDYGVDEEGKNYVTLPGGLQVTRVSQSVLGPNVLGRTWIGSGQIQVLDTLYGDAFKEVLQHEVNHQLYPHENESEIRARTRRQVPNPIYH